MGRRQLPVARARRFNAARLQRELHRERMTPRTLHDVIRKYARLRTNGKPVRCYPSVNEVDGAKLHSRGKVIFNSVERARDCALELVKRFEDTETTYVYPCNRSRHGHVHMTRKNTGLTLLEVRADGNVVARTRSSNVGDR